MTSIKKILFATDFSKVSRRAQETAAYLKKELGCALEVVHVFDETAFQMPGPYYFMTGVEQWLDDRLSAMRERGREALNEVCSQLGGVEGHFLEGKPGRVIVETAHEGGADLIVMGTHGHRGWNRLMLGSVAEYVTRHAQCALLSIKPQGSLDEDA